LRWWPFSHRQDRNASLADLPIFPYMQEFVAEMRDVGLPVRITSVLRTQEEQDELYEQGRTTPGPIVTWTRNSPHIHGRAFDFAFRQSGLSEYDDDPDAWDFAGEIGEGLGLVWGPSKGIPDYGHFELPGGTLG